MLLVTLLYVLQAVYDEMPGGSMFCIDCTKYSYRPAQHLVPVRATTSPMCPPSQTRPECKDQVNHQSRP